MQLENIYLLAVVLYIQTPETLSTFILISKRCLEVIQTLKRTLNILPLSTELKLFKRCETIDLIIQQNSILPNFNSAYLYHITMINPTTEQFNFINQIKNQIVYLKIINYNANSSMLLEQQSTITQTSFHTTLPFFQRLKKLILINSSLTLLTDNYFSSYEYLYGIDIIIISASPFNLERLINSINPLFVNVQVLCNIVNIKPTIFNLLQNKIKLYNNHILCNNPLTRVILERNSYNEIEINTIYDMNKHISTLLLKEISLTIQTQSDIQLLYKIINDYWASNIRVIINQLDTEMNFNLISYELYSIQLTNQSITKNIEINLPTTLLSLQISHQVMFTNTILPCLQHLAIQITKTLLNLSLYPSLHFLKLSRCICKTINDDESIQLNDFKSSYNSLSSLSHSNQKFILNDIQLPIMNELHCFKTQCCIVSNTIPSVQSIYIRDSICTLNLSDWKYLINVEIINSQINQLQLSQSVTKLKLSQCKQLTNLQLIGDYDEINIKNLYQLQAIDLSKCNSISIFTLHSIHLSVLNLQHTKVHQFQMIDCNIQLKK